MTPLAGTVLPLAHFGHWWTYVLYAVPVIIVLVSVAMTLIRERRGQRERSEDSDVEGERAHDARVRPQD